MSRLKKTVGEGQQVSTVIPTTVEEIRVPEYILDRKMVTRGNQAVTKVLIQWKHMSLREATWEYLYDI